MGATDATAAGVGQATERRSAEQIRSLLGSRT
jgi:hypothetical protein